MDEKQNQPIQLSFNASLKVDFQGSRVTFHGGLILVRELDERLGLEKFRTLERLTTGLEQPVHAGRSTPAVVYSRLAGYKDLAGSRSTITTASSRSRISNSQRGLLGFTAALNSETPTV